MPFLCLVSYCNSLFSPADSFFSVSARSECLGTKHNISLEMNTLLERDVSGIFIFYHSSLLLWTGCGDRHGNKMPTDSFKVFGSRQGEYLLKRKKESAWKGVESGGTVGAGVGRASAGSIRADGSEQQ